MEEKESQSIEDNLPMVNYIMLHRIYDMLTIMANNVDAEKTAKMIEYHEQGFLLGPAPSFTPTEDSVNQDA
jgi:hypothetical protein